MRSCTSGQAINAITPRLTAITLNWPSHISNSLSVKQNHCLTRWGESTYILGPSLFNYIRVISLLAIARLIIFNLIIRSTATNRWSLWSFVSRPYRLVPRLVQTRNDQYWMWVNIPRAQELEGKREAWQKLARHLGHARLRGLAMWTYANEYERL